MQQNINFNDFCNIWYKVKTATMGTILRLLGELSHEETRAMLGKNLSWMDSVQKIREEITFFIINETNIKNNAASNSVYHNQLFKQYAEIAGAKIDIDFDVPIESVKDFLRKILAVQPGEIKELLGFYLATHELSRSVSDKMFEYFRQAETSEVLLRANEIFEIFRIQHHQPSFTDLNVNKGDRCVILGHYKTWKERWSEVLRDLELQPS